MDITRNLFYWFRGPTHQADPLSHRQLENNLTKALVTVLDKCERKAVLRAFLGRLALKLSDNIAFSLQRRPPVAAWPPKKLVVAIAGGDEPIRGQSAGASQGRPDAWICCDRWAILVESKVGPSVQTKQLVGHANAAGWAPGTYDVKQLSWQEVHAICKATKDQIPQRNLVSHILLADWLSYLEFQNMADFEELEAVDFDFCNLPAEEQDAMLPHMKKRVRAFASLVAQTPSARAIERLHGDRGRGKWKVGDPTKGRQAWFNIGGGSSHRTWHATVFFTRDGLHVDVLNSDAWVARALCNAGVDDFAKVFHLAARSDDLLVACRRARYADPSSPYKGQRIKGVDEPLTVKPSLLSDSVSRESCALMVRAMMKRLLAGRRDWRTELHVRREIPRWKILELSGDDQVKLVDDALATLHPVLEHLLASSRG